MWTHFVLILQLVHFGNCFKIFEWQRDWGGGVFTRELAQVLPDVKQFVHSATDSSALNNVPAITLSIYNSQVVEFPNGMVVIRPLLSEGNQICFIGHISGRWSADYNTLRSRHGATISADIPETYDLDPKFPGDLDPLSISSITDFCGVDRSHVFYMTTTTNVPSGSTITLKIQGPFGGYSVLVREEMEQSILGINY